MGPKGWAPVPHDHKVAGLKRERRSGLPIRGPNTAAAPATVRGKDRHETTGESAGKGA